MPALRGVLSIPKTVSRSARVVENIILYDLILGQTVFRPFYEDPAYADVDECIVFNGIVGDIVYDNTVAVVYESLLEVCEDVVPDGDCGSILIVDGLAHDSLMKAETDIVLDQDVLCVSGPVSPIEGLETIYVGTTDFVHFRTVKSVVSQDVVVTVKAGIVGVAEAIKVQPFYIVVFNHPAFSLDVDACGAIVDLVESNPDVSGILIPIALDYRVSSDIKDVIIQHGGSVRPDKHWIAGGPVCGGRCRNIESPDGDIIGLHFESAI